MALSKIHVKTHCEFAKLSSFLALLRVSQSLTFRSLEASALSKATKISYMCLHGLKARVRAQDQQCRPFQRQQVQLHSLISADKLTPSHSNILCHLMKTKIVESHLVKKRQ
jgi:hypothetical protein